MSKDAVLFSTIFNNLGQIICFFINTIANISKVLAKFYETDERHYLIFLCYNFSLKL